MGIIIDLDFTQKRVKQISPHPFSKYLESNKIIMKRALTNHGLEALLDTFKEQKSGEEKFSIKISEISALNSDKAKLMAVDGLGDRKRKKTEDERSVQKFRIIEEQADNLSRLTLVDKITNNSNANLRSHPTGGSWIQKQLGEERYRLMLIDELSG